ncbi:MAG: Ppx/GppA phosphatase family protein [Acidimicrobiaceae bacterium]|nr:Ppx/GppA phosphatase family protein [Acidimicrobiaceae bacterium]MYE64669.1 Ppx/GppA family phosphatase [Acidimicrobiaceae bacterium]
MTGSRALAAIDVGTNSVHMVIARPVPGGSPDVLVRERMPVRLGSGGADMRCLLPDAIDRAIAALVECRHIADAHDAEVVAVATSAVREADNQSDFLRRANSEAHVTVQVISGMEEARLIHLGAMSAVPIAGRSHLVIDIGGGSTEVIVGNGTAPALARSLKLGHIRLTDRFFPAGVIDDGAVKACRRHIRSFIAPVAQEAKSMGFEVAVGCSGTIAALAYVCAARRGETLRTPANAVIERSDLTGVVNELISRPRPADRLKVPGLDPARSDVIVGGAVLLRQLFKALEIESMVVSTGALREGLLLDRFNRRDRSRDDGLHHLSDLRRSSVLALARSYHEDLIHAEHATDLALELFDETATAHGLGIADSEVLEAAGLLHNIGRFVAHSSHHKHSYYLIRHSERLAGFTEGDLELIALVARYHRKREPVSSHREFTALAKRDRFRVRVLAGLLRIGIALDRTYRRAVERVHAHVEDDVVRIEVEVAEGSDVDIELFTAQRSADLLAKTLGRRLEFHIVGTGAARHRHPSSNNLKTAGQ